MGILDFLFWLKPNIKRMESRKDVRGLIKALKYKRDSFVRTEAARALGAIGDARAVEALTHALRDPDRCLCD
jgi:HEAT repeat protein